MAAIDCLLQEWICCLVNHLCVLFILYPILRCIHRRILRHQLTEQLGNIHCDLADRKAVLFDRTIGNISREYKERDKVQPFRKRVKVVELSPGAGHNFRHYPRGTWLTTVQLDRDDIKASLTQSALHHYRHLIHLEEEIIATKAGQKMSVGGNRSGLALPWLRGKVYDAVVATFVISGVSSAATSRRLIAEAARILRPGGYLLIIDRAVSDRFWSRCRQRLVRPLSSLFYLRGGRPLPRQPEERDGSGLLDRRWGFKVELWERFPHSSGETLVQLVARKL